MLINVKMPLIIFFFNFGMNISYQNKTQEGHGGPELLTYTMCTSHISLCDTREAHIWPQGHYLKKFGGGTLGDAAYQISRFYSLWFLTKRFNHVSLYKTM